MRVNTGNTVALSKVSFYQRNAGEYQAKRKKEDSRSGKSSKKTNELTFKIKQKIKIKANQGSYQLVEGLWACYQILFTCKKHNLLVHYSPLIQSMNFPKGNSIILQSGINIFWRPCSVLVQICVLQLLQLDNFNNDYTNVWWANWTTAI